jgi:imidazolonepropionase-like amidohydrolase
VGLGRPQEQLPRSAVGALLALGQLLDGVQAGQEVEAFGPRAVRDLKPLVEAKIPWRLSAVEAYEIAALLDFAEQRRLPLVVDGAHFADAQAERLAALGVGVIYELPFVPNRGGSDRGKDPEQPWPSLDVPGKLAAAGVKLAITQSSGSSLQDLRFAAIAAKRGGLSAEKALASITRVPAELLGVADRVGSLQNGRDADFVVLSGAPMEAGSSVLGTYVAGRSVWTPESSALSEAARNEALTRGYDPRTPPLVLSVAELHLGDGRVLTPGEVLVQAGRISEVGAKVARPAGARVVSGTAAMPGMIDALGFLGLEGIRRIPGLDFDLTRILEPGDRIDRRVAQAGVTTVALNFRGSSGGGVPVVAYHPAADRPEDLAVDGLAALRMPWGEDLVYEAGKELRELLSKVAEYDQAWREYDQKLAAWKPEAPRPEFKLPPEPKDEVQAEPSEEAKPEGATAEGEKAEDKKKKKSKDVDPDPVTGIWLAEFGAEGADRQTVRMQLRLGEAIAGTGAAATPADAAPKEEAKPSEEPAPAEKSNGDAPQEEAKPEDDKPAKEQAEDKKEPEKKEKKPAKEEDKPTGPDRRVEGWLRSALLSERLLSVQGVYKADGSLTLEGVAQNGPFTFAGKLSDITVDAEEVRYPATVKYNGLEVVADAKRESREYPEAKRPVREGVEEKPAEEPKGKPKAPRGDPRLDALRRAMRGELALLIEVNRGVEIVAAVDACAAVGIQPVLVGASEALSVAGQIRGRVRGVLPNQSIVAGSGDDSRGVRNVYAELQSAGLPVAFHSDAEEGAADLQMMAAYAMANGMSPSGALRALTGDAAKLLCIEDQVGVLEVGRFGDLLLLDQSPLTPAARVERVWVAGREVR